MRENKVNNPIISSSELCIRGYMQLIGKGNRPFPDFIYGTNISKNCKRQGIILPMKNQANITDNYVISIHDFGRKHKIRDSLRINISFRVFKVLCLINQTRGRNTVSYTHLTLPTIY